MTPNTRLPEQITSEEQLDEILSRPTPDLVKLMRRIEGDIIILGAGGKMGVSLGMLAARAVAEARVVKEIIAVSRFTEPDSEAKLTADGVETISCDLLDPQQTMNLPPVENVIFMAGRKFGTDGDEPLTWALNTVLPVNVAHRFRGSRIVAFSTGNVYPPQPAPGSGCTESTPPQPVGEYAQSCLGRERIFQYYSTADNTPACLMRLNYAVDLRYGVLHDIAVKVQNGEPVDLAMGYVNLIWQGDANLFALRCLEQCATPAAALNVTGPSAYSVRELAQSIAEIMGKPVSFTGAESDVAYLSDASRAIELFGAPAVSVEQMLRWNAHWVMSGGRSLGKPTHFETFDGRY